MSSLFRWFGTSGFPAIFRFLHSSLRFIMLLSCILSCIYHALSYCCLSLLSIICSTTSFLILSRFFLQLFYHYSSFIIYAGTAWFFLHPSFTPSTCFIQAVCPLCVCVNSSLCLTWVYHLVGFFPHCIIMISCCHSPSHLSTHRYPIVSRYSLCLPAFLWKFAYDGKLC